ncbi:dihydrodipicolinate synthase family protein [Streptomyces sp. NPDC056683]|uniref:dihydrodipicolinate synthase family protein n=1 Tax=Streptomyces sp. NPDC056683 TaxID=3345910 RepID=UPI00369DD9E2
MPLCVYDNPRTTQVHFTDELHGRISRLPNVRSIGVSGDWAGVSGLNAGCDVWYSAMGGLFPRTALALARAALPGDAGRATESSDALKPLWELLRQYGGLRVLSAAASHLGLTSEPNLPRPLRGLDEASRRDVTAVLDALQLTT